MPGPSLMLSMVDVARGTVQSGTYKPLNNDQRKNPDKPYVGIRSSGREKLQKAERMRRNTRSGSLVHDACLQHQQNFTTSALNDGDGV